MKRMMIWMLLLLIGTSMSAACTYAYLTDQDRAENKVDVTENRIHIEEVFEPPTDPAPGSVIKKAPSIVNDSRVEVYVRMSAVFSDSAAEELCLPLVISSHWKKGTDGYYYYDRALKAGEKTEPLFEKLILKEEITPEQIVPFDVLVYAESVQSYGFTAEEAWNAFGIGSEV